MGQFIYVVVVNLFYLCTAPVFIFFVLDNPSDLRQNVEKVF